MSRQLRLALHEDPAADPAAFVVSASNREAGALIDAWPDWPGGALALAGPEDAGKSHLANMWAERADAVAVTGAELATLDREALADRPLLIDPADDGVDEEALFHLLNRAAASGGALLIVARQPPSDWSCRVPDLRSRLNALTVARVYPPDDALLREVLQRFLRARLIVPVDEVLDYLVQRMERSAPRARQIALQIDETLNARPGRPLTRALAREILDEAERTGDLFAISPE